MADLEPPDYQTCMRPVLQVLADGGELHVRDIRDGVAGLLGVTEEAREVMLPSGRQRTFDNRVGWAVTYLDKAECLSRPRRGHAVITQRGLDLLASSEPINTKRLEGYEAFVEFRERGGDDIEAGSTATLAKSTTAVETDADPDEAIAWGIAQINDVLADDLLDQLKAITPTQFERVVIDVLLSMGYGGPELDGRQLGQSGDEGVDGVIREDPLGLDVIYVQAKKYTDNPISRPDVQGFVGALHGKNASKGVFITTTRFTREAINYVENLTPRVVLIDGPQLADIMIERGVGVSTRETYYVKRIDTDYFTDL